MYNLDEVRRLVTAMQLECIAACTEIGERTQMRKISADNLITRLTCDLRHEREREEQRRSFAYGNLAIDHPSATREDVDQAAEELDDRRCEDTIGSGGDAHHRCELPVGHDVHKHQGTRWLIIERGKEDL